MTVIFPIFKAVYRAEVSPDGVIFATAKAPEILRSTVSVISNSVLITLKAKLSSWASLSIPLSIVVTSTMYRVALNSVLPLMLRSPLESSRLSTESGSIGPLTGSGSPTWPVPEALPVIRRTKSPVKSIVRSTGVGSSAPGLSASLVPSPSKSN